MIYKNIKSAAKADAERLRASTEQSDREYINKQIEKEKNKNISNKLTMLLISPHIYFD